MADRHGLWRERLAKTTSSSVAGEHSLSDCCPFYFIRAGSFVSVPALVGALLVFSSQDETHGRTPFLSFAWCSCWDIGVGVLTSSSSNGATIRKASTSFCIVASCCSFCLRTSYTFFTASSWTKQGAGTVLPAPPSASKAFLTLLRLLNISALYHPCRLFSNTRTPTTNQELRRLLALNRIVHLMDSNRSVGFRTMARLVVLL
jgi:hypothetical protein